jgi:putative SOS response-associated peptidase YedK
MCNDYEQLTKWEEYVSLMHAVDLGTPTHQGEADLPAAVDIRIGDTGPVMRAAGNVIEVAPMRFGFPPRQSTGSLSLAIPGWESRGCGERPRTR